MMTNPGRRKAEPGGEGRELEKNRCGRDAKKGIAATAATMVCELEEVARGQGMPADPGHQRGEHGDPQLKPRSVRRSGSAGTIMRWDGLGSQVAAWW